MSTQSVQLPNQPEIEQVAWEDKHQAAKRMGVSPSRALGIAEEQKFQTKPGRNRKNQPIVLIHTGDIARYIVQRDNPEAQPSQALQPPRQVGQEGRALPTWFQQALQELQPLKTPQAKPWLTLDEAVEFSGLTKRFLKDEAESDANPEDQYKSAIAIRDMGKHAPGGRWRFHRDSLAQA